MVPLLHPSAWIAAPSQTVAKTENHYNEARMGGTTFSIGFTTLIRSPVLQSPRHTYLKSTSLSDPKTSRLDWVCLHHLSARIYRKYIIFNDLLLSLSQKLSGQRASGIGRSVSVRNQTVVKHQCQKLTNPKNGL